MKGSLAKRARSVADGAPGWKGWGLVWVVGIEELVLVVGVGAKQLVLVVGIGVGYSG
jgi:hypothetical protein